MKYNRSRKRFIFFIGVIVLVRACLIIVREINCESSLKVKLFVQLSFTFETNVLQIEPEIVMLLSSVLKNGKPFRIPKCFSWTL